MARIRSVHPSLFTDERWVECSPLARVLYVGLLCEADDQGLFEWKPLQLKMRLLPGDNVDMGALMGELVAVDLIATLESGGKKLGAIRKFRRFQRPKKPNSQFVLPVEWRTYVGLDEPSGETGDDDDDRVRNQFRTRPEIDEQKEDGGGRKEEISSEPTGSGGEPPVDRDDLAELRALDLKTGAWRLALKLLMARGGYPDSRARPMVGKWAKAHAPAELWKACEAAWAAGTLDPVSYVTAALERIASEDDDPLLNPSETRQRLWMQDFITSPGQWREHERGPKPGTSGCRVSPEIQREFGIEPAKPQPIERVA